VIHVSTRKFTDYINAHVFIVGMYSANFRVYKYFIKNNDTCRLEKAPGQSKHDTLSPDNKHRLTEK